MAWLNWFSSKNNKAPANARAQHTDVPTSQQMDYSRPIPGVRAPNGVMQPATTASNQRLEQRRNERNAKRELLFQVVRESMVRVGVLSSAFKFKVLSLDQRGRSFLVMIELSAEFSGEVEKLAEIESMISHTARHRFEIMVQAVYWRYFNATAANVSAPAPLLGALHAPISRPAPLFGMHGSGSTVSPAPAPNPALAALQARAAANAAQALLQRNTGINPGMTGSFPIIGATAAQKTAGAQSLSAARAAQDELGDDEVTAFRRALAAGAAHGAMAAPAMPTKAFATAPAAAAAKPAVIAAISTTPAHEISLIEQARSKLLLTGYEDTEMADDDPMPALSGTQYGDLR